MSRAAILPTPGDPFLLTLWIKFFKEVWCGEIDRLYICVNNDFLVTHDEYISSLIDDLDNVNIEFVNTYSNPSYIEIDRRTHGSAIAHTLSKVTEDFVVFIEDDGFIFKSGYIDYYFSLLENDTYDLIGSPRASCSSIIAEESSKKYYLIDEEWMQPNWWPCFFFAKKKIFDLTDNNFSERGWAAGDILPIFNVVLDEVCASDTMVWMSMQLRNLNLKIGRCPQFHGNPSDSDDYTTKTGLFNGSAFWMHAGSLSSGLNGFISNKPLPNYCNTYSEKIELERRIAFWSLGLDIYMGGTNRIIDEFALEYSNLLDRLIDGYGLSRERLDASKRMYSELFLWI